MKKALLISLGILFFATAAIVMNPIDLLLEKMIFFPTDDTYITPDRMGLSYEDIHFPTEDGLTLHGWFVPSDKEDAITLLFFHGNAGNITHRTENVMFLHRLGLSVFIIDYRGYRLSEGLPSEKGLYLDGEAAYRHLKERSDINHDKIAFFGRSLGGAVAIDLASKVSCAALVIESSFVSSKSVAKDIFPLLPTYLAMGERFANLSKLKTINIPLLILHGTDDEIIPYKQGELLFEGANEPKSFYPIKGAGHNDTYIRGGKPYFETIISFLNKYIPE